MGALGSRPLSAGVSVQALRAWLADATGQNVDMVETHISWVLLTPRLAFKLKKPVRLSFVDFSTLQARKHFCDEELRLNKRLAPSLYLRVLSVRGTPSQPRIGGGGEPIDHVVCMRRFPDSALLRDLVVNDVVVGAAGMLDSFAQRLASFHARVERAAADSAFGEPAQIMRAMHEVLNALPTDAEGAIADRLAKLRAWTQDRAQALQPAWQARRLAGAVRECHGDLHLANIVRLDGELTAFDCIEFDPALRWIDVMSDVAFLTMDLAAHHRPRLAFRFLDAWLQHSGDYAGMAVFSFYEVYRSLVRALASSPAAGHGGMQDVPDYIATAERLTQSAQGGPRLLITYGFSGSGKSSVALRLLQGAGAVRIRSDVERKRLFGLDALARSSRHGIDLYADEVTRRTFDHLQSSAAAVLRAGYPVIVDAAFLGGEQRRAFRALASSLGVPFAILHCRAAEATLRQRVARRTALDNDASDADLDVLERQLATHEPLSAEERALTFDVCTDIDIDIDIDIDADIAALCARWQDQHSPADQWSSVRK
ncbi:MULTISPECIES: AAA family ATPase [unclassified Variovorax]|uniref:bifunctional aminoglycoside phosphotransferase/ATP-binding protein n=1 Tax=unclassified Variovorax TaxID=663243 RepID=UPI002B226EF6|nr:MULTISPECIES: AAA family ATPase [unclassified Variovorax]MEB0057702.1 AAA family ATPase [Variovorax sp. LG9.2]MEB0113008.1 AAA family ATPase [Variovorax sp. RTB1]